MEGRQALCGAGSMKTEVIKNGTKKQSCQWNYWIKP